MLLFRVDDWYKHGHTESMKTAVSIPDDLFIAADKLAENLGTTRSGLYARALAAYLAEYQSTLITDKLNEYYGETDSRLDPIWGQLQARALPKDDTW